MNNSASKRRLSFLIATEEEHEILGPTSKLHLYKSFANEKSLKHKVVAGVYERPQLKAPYDSNIVKEVLVKSERYKNLRPNVVFQILDKRSKYEHLKKLALLRLKTNLRMKFAIFSKIIDHKEHEAKASDELSHGIFSWKWDDFLTRRRLKDFVWVDMLLKTKEIRLHLYKFQTDLDELQSFLVKIFDGLFSNIGEENVDIYQHIEKPIDEAKKALHTTDYVEEEFYVNYKELKSLLYKEYFFINPKRNSEDRFLKTYLENRIWNSHIWDPIEVRYQINWFNNIVKQNQYHMNGTVEKYETDIAHCKKMLNNEKFIDANYMDYCYSSMEMYKNRLIKIQNKFDKECEEMDNKLVDIRLQTVKLREQRRWLSDEIQLFHEEEEKIHNRIEFEKEIEKQRQMKSKELIAKKVIRKKSKKKRR